MCALFLALSGCNGEVECKSEVTEGGGTYTGSAKGKSDDPNVKKESIKEACRQMCAGTKATLVEPCAVKCAVDAEAGKLGAKTTCG